MGSPLMAPSKLTLSSNGRCSASCAEYERLVVMWLQKWFKRFFKAGDIRVVAKEFSIFYLHTIACLHFFYRSGRSMQVGKNIFFVRNGDTKALQRVIREHLFYIFNMLHGIIYEYTIPDIFCYKFLIKIFF